MKLSALFDNAPEIEIENLMVDSREPLPQSIFFCVKGMLHDGHRYVSSAIKNGAVCIVHSEDIKRNNSNVVYIKVRDVITALNQVATCFYHYPSKKLKVFGVTGTNGKSSIACMIKSLYPHQLCGYIGTISIEYGKVKLPPLLTTPDIIPLQKTLSDMVQAKMEACALEISSIGLEQRRTDGVDVDVAVFTNLTHDHLDYHGTMENYFAAKKRLFDQLKPEGVAIYNADDPYGALVVANTKARRISYSVMADADYRAYDIQLTAEKTIFSLSTKGGEYRIETNLVAMFNIYNLLAVIAAMVETGTSMESIMEKLNSIPQIEGRMEKINEGQPFNIVVDFAHTPDGLEKIFQFASSITPKEKRIIAVFGSAGKRDTKKRPIFGSLAAKYCDLIILTEDDPRDESPVAIAEEIASGIKKTNHIIIESRYDAIRQAIEVANVKDTVLILGKGDETFIYREFGREPWISDPMAVREILHKYYFEIKNEGENEGENDEIIE